MFSIKIADITLEIDNRYSHVKDYCKGWESEEAPLFRVKVTNEEIAVYMHNSGIPNMTEAVAERVLVYRKICARLTRYGIFLIHGALVSYNGRGIIFSAPRGVGKTTHVKNWLEAFGKDAEIINGDKPLIKKQGDRYIAYGTPWRGKELLGRDGCVEISAVCFLERGKQSVAARIRPSEAALRMAGQSIYPDDETVYDAYSQDIADFLSAVPSFAAAVTIGVESATAVRNAIFNL